MKRLQMFFVAHKTLVLSMVFLVLFSFTVSRAAPLYNPGQTLDPACAPGATDCTVSGVSAWNENAGDVSLTGGSVGIGTATPTETLDVVGSVKFDVLNAGVVSVIAASTGKTTYFRASANTDAARGTALQNAFAAAAASDTIIIGSGSYSLTSTLTVLNYQTVIIQSSFIYNTTNTSDVFSSGAIGWAIKGNGRLGGQGIGVGGAYTDQAGIRITGTAYKWSISDLDFGGFKGAAIDAVALPPHFVGGGKIANVRLATSTYGLYVGIREEYLQVTNSEIYGNTTGIYVAGGNFQAANLNIEDNGTGVYLDNQDNSAHGQFTGTNINHNTTYSVYANSVGNGMDFVGCHFYGGASAPIYIYASQGIQFLGGEMGSGTVITMDGVFTGYNTVKNVWLVGSEPTINGTTLQKSYLILRNNITGSTNTSTSETPLSGLIVSGNVGIGTTTPSSALTIGGNSTAAAWGTNGINFQTVAATYTDSSSSGTVANAAINSFGQPTLAASSATTYTNSSTLYIAGAPIAGTNATITNPWALNVAAGNSKFGGTITVSGIASGSAGDFVVNGGSGLLVTRTASQVLTDIGAAASTGSTAYIQNGTSPQTSSNFNIDGNGVIGGVLAIGSNATIESALYRTSKTVGFFTPGFSSEVIINRSANSTGAVRSFISDDSIGATNTASYTNTDAGMQSFAATMSIAAGATGTVTSVASFRSAFTNSTAMNIGTIWGAKYLAPVNTGGGTITNTVGVGIAGSAAATNNTVLLVGTLSPAVGNWGIYSASANNNYLGSGFTGIGQTSPTTLLYVGSSAASGTVATFQNSAATCTLNPVNAGSISCSSDMNLKKNITTLDDAPWAFNNNITFQNNDILTKILALKPVTYNWNPEQNTDPKHVGFIAQEVQEIFPDLVLTDPNTHLLSMNYTGLIPYTVEAVKEMNFNIRDLSDLTKTNSWRDSIVAWFGSTTNGIGDFVATRIRAKDQICINQTCVTEQQLQQVLQNSHSSGSTTVVNPPVQQTPEVTPPVVEDTVPEVTPEPEAPADEVTPPADSAAE